MVAYIVSILWYTHAYIIEGYNIHMYMPVYRHSFVYIAACKTNYQQFEQTALLKELAFY